MDIKLVPLTADDREQFILDNQQAFKYGAQEEFGMRDDRMEEGEEVISRKTELEILFIKPDAHSKGLGQAAWKEVEIIHPEISVWETMTPYFEKRNIHFYVNRLGFHIVEFWNKYQRGPAVPEDIEENWSDEDEMFLFRKIITKK